MSLKRSELREKSMIILYQYSLLSKNNLESIDNIIKDNLELSNDYVKTLVHGVIDNQKEIDKYANKYLKDWTIDRLDKTAASILRMAIYELLYMDTPDIVVINEAVELAKKYCNENVKNMINAVLDKLLRS